MVCCEAILIEPVKTNDISFRNRPPDTEINILINNQQITRVHVTKCLGVYIDDVLNHVQGKFSHL